MNINDLENSLGDFTVKQPKILEHLMYMALQNNAMLNVILENQSRINVILDPSKNFEEDRIKLLEQVKKEGDETFAFLMNKINDN